MNYDVMTKVTMEQIHKLYSRPEEILRDIHERYDTEQNKDGYVMPYVAKDLAYDDALRTLTRLYRQHNSKIMLLVFDNPEDHGGLDCELYVRSTDEQWKYRHTPVSRMGNTLDVPTMSELEWTEMMATETRRLYSNKNLLQKVPALAAMTPQ
jgi:hypothetical protein